MCKKMKVTRNYVEWMAELLPEYQHEDVSELGDNIHKCLDTKARKFVIIFKSVVGHKTRINSHDPKRLVKAYFHNLVLVKIVPSGTGRINRSA